MSCPPSKTIAKKSKLKKRQQQSDNSQITDASLPCLHGLFFGLHANEQRAIHKTPKMLYIYTGFIKRRTQTFTEPVRNQTQCCMICLIFLIYLLTEKSMNSYDRSQANCSDSALHYSSDLGINPLQVRPRTRSHTLHVGMSAPSLWRRYGGYKVKPPVT